MKKKEKVEPKKETTIIPGKYFFTTEEKRDMANSLANKQIDMNIIEDEKKSVMASYADRLKRIQWDIKKISRGIVDGFETRDFEVYVEKDFDRHIKKFVCIRTKRVIDEAPLDPSDYQQTLL